jgi:hypothetical protein
VGLRLAAHPDVSPEDLMTAPLDLFVAGDLAVRDRLATAYDTLDADAQRLFVRLSTVETLAPDEVTGMSPRRARALFDAIADSGLLHRPAKAPYRLSGPAREFAMERS